MHHVHDVTSFLEDFAPTALAETWDNVGLLLGDRHSNLERVLTCLTLTPDVADEAIREGVGLIITHHPILFRAVKRITTESAEGAMLLALTKAGVAVYSPHTAFDSATGGINDLLAAKLGVTDARPLRHAATTTDGSVGSGRYGTCRACTFPEFVSVVRSMLELPPLDVVSTSRPIKTIGIACGSAAEYLSDADNAGCDVLVTGEARFHAALEARSRGVGLVLLGHYASERFAVEELAEVLTTRFPSLTVWPSRDERDPLERL